MSCDPRAVLAFAARRGLAVGLLCLLAGAGWAWPAQAREARDGLQPRVVRLATGELPPYASSSRADQGVALHIVRRALQLAGHEVRYTFMPWGRAQAEAKAGLWDGSAIWGRRLERERDFLLSDNVLTEQWVVLYRDGLAMPDWQVPADLSAFTFAAIPSFTYTPEFLARFHDGRLKVDWTPDDLAGLRKLAAGRVDMMLEERQVACHLLETEFAAAEASLVHVHPRLIAQPFTTHLILPRLLPGSRALLRDFNRGLAALHASGEYQRLLAEAACRSDLPRPE